jgi:hypothetical protein
MSVARKINFPEMTTTVQENVATVEEDVDVIESSQSFDSSDAKQRSKRKKKTFDSSETKNTSIRPSKFLSILSFSSK